LKVLNTRGVTLEVLDRLLRVMDENDENSEIVEDFRRFLKLLKVAPSLSSLHECPETCSLKTSGRIYRIRIIILSSVAYQSFIHFDLLLVDCSDLRIVS
jgi:hypothetical protein